MHILIIPVPATYFESAVILSRRRRRHDVDRNRNSIGLCIQVIKTCHMKAGHRELARLYII
jgi:hypothetical protein